jgi:hypothetical protein
MLYGLKKIGVMGGHGDGANAIPSQFATTATLQAYREGTAMRMLATKLSEIPGIVNLRPGPEDIPWSERAKLIANAGCDVGVELHTNWSLNSAGQPNSNVFLVIIALYNPIHDVEEQKLMATKLYQPLAQAMGMKFEIRTKKGGGEWDWYSFINECNRKSIPYPFIVEHGYHIDYASHEDWYRRLIVSQYKDIAESSDPIPDPIPPDPVNENEPEGYIVHAGLFSSKENAASEKARLESLGYQPWLQCRNGVYVLRTAYNKVIEYAMASAIKFAKMGFESGIIVI